MLPRPLHQPHPVFTGIPNNQDILAIFSDLIGNERTTNENSCLHELQRRSHSFARSPGGGGGISHFHRPISELNSDLGRNSPICSTQCVAGLAIFIPQSSGHTQRAEWIRWGRDLLADTCWVLPSFAITTPNHCFDQISSHKFSVLSGHVLTMKRHWKTMKKIW